MSPAGFGVPRAFLIALAIASPLVSSPSFALSQFPGEDGETLRREGIISVPLPPLNGSQRPTEAGGDASGDDAPSSAPGEPGRPPDLDGDPDAPATEAPPARPLEAPLLPVRYEEDGLAEPVRDLRRRLIEIARAGEIEALRPYIETGAEPTELTFGVLDGDPIEFLKESSGDGEGVEILAILLETLLAGHVQLEAGAPEEIYVWPYFTQVPLDRLTKPQLVELFELVTAGDYERMLGNGAYDFYRVGISPDGRLEFFIAGD